MEKNTSSASSLTGSTTPVRHGPQLTVWSKGMENKKKECRTRDREFKGHTEDPWLDQRSIQIEMQQNAVRGQV